MSLYTIVVNDVHSVSPKTRLGVCVCMCVPSNSTSQPSLVTSAELPPRQTTQGAAGKAAKTSQRLLEQMDNQLSSVAAMTQRMQDQFNNIRLVSHHLIFVLLFLFLDVIF